MKPEVSWHEVDHIGREQHEDNNAKDSTNHRLERTNNKGVLDVLFIHLIQPDQDAHDASKCASKGGNGNAPRVLQEFWVLEWASQRINDGAIPVLLDSLLLEGSSMLSYGILLNCSIRLSSTIAE